VRDASDHDVVTEAALAARYRQRRLVLLVALLVATVVPIVAMGAWWLWPLLVVPAVLAAPLAGATGLIATLLVAAIALASASAGDVGTAQILSGFAAIIIVAALGAAHAGMTDGLVDRMGRAADPMPGLAPGDVFDLIADRDCRRAAAGGTPVSVAVVAMPRVDSVARRHGMATLHALLDAASSAVVRATPASDLVVEQGDGRYVALVAGTSDMARDVARRIAASLDGVAVRDASGATVTAGAVATGVAEWEVGDPGPDALIERATAAMLRDLVGADGHADEGATGEFTAVAVADAA
jgi:GGDEF domain-containing protein